VATADIDKPFEAGEVIGSYDGCSLVPNARFLRGLKGATALGMLLP
jgi:hypothetical protein